MPHYTFIKRSLAIALALFPILAVIAFILHFHAWSDFFTFRLIRQPYHAEALFNALVSGHGHGFLIAHIFIDMAVPFLLLTILTLSWYTLKVPQPQSPSASNLSVATASIATIIAILGAAMGILGCLAMAGVIASWLSFTALAHVAPQYYDGARAALVELTRMQGMLHVNTRLSYLTFYGLIILAATCWSKRIFPARNMLLIMLGSLLFILFMDMDNWMMIGTLLLCAGLLPVMKKLWN